MKIFSWILQTIQKQIKQKSRLKKKKKKTLGWFIKQNKVLVTQMKAEYSYD